MRKIGLSGLDRALKDRTRLAYSWLRRPRLSSPCALHGIQRSGTNYLQACLTQLEVAPLNCIVEVARNHPRHKHFRWNSDKSSIPAFIDAQFGNDMTAANIDEVNTVARYPRSCRHLVMQKPKIPWLASACNWGLRVNWFVNRQDALNNLDALECDYDAYYGFWHKLASDAPDQVLILQLEALRTDFGLLPDGLDRLGIRFRCPSDFAGRIDQVTMSPPDRPQMFSVQDILTSFEKRDAD